MTLRRHWLRHVLDDPRDRFGLLLALLVTSIAVAGVDTSPAIRVLVSLLNVAVMVVAFMATGLRRGRVVLLPLVLLGMVGSGLAFSPDSQELVVGLGATAQAVVLAAATVAVVRRIVRHRTVSGQTLLGAVSAYLLLGQMYAWIYLALPGYQGGDPVLDPAIAGSIPLYYSYVVLTTLGFGDVTPIGALAQRITVLEALMGQMFLAILVARLVSMYPGVTRSPDDVTD